MLKKIRNKLILWLAGDMLVIINAKVCVVENGSSFRLGYGDDFLCKNVRSICHKNFAPEITRLTKKV